ncbi:MAG TPA: hypothetical protein VIK72_00440 [Clostridiaceae bacterium]
MKSKSILSLVMAAAVTLGGAAIATNANFNATATSNGNTITMGTVRVLNTGIAEGQSITMDTLFDASNLGTLNTVSKSTTLVNSGTLPITLSMLPRTKTGTTVPSDVISTYYRHYKMAVSMQVTRKDGIVNTMIHSRVGDSQLGSFDAIFDTIDGEINHIGSAQTTGIKPMLESIGTLYPGDKVTIGTDVRFDQTAYYTSLNSMYTLTPDEVNAFQGKSLKANLTIVATEAPIE